MTDETPVASTAATPDGEPITTEPDNAASTETQPTLSKSQQKKLARKAKIEAERPARRAREKAARKEKRAVKRKLVEEEGADPIAIGLHKKPRTVNGQKHPFNANIVIDLSFDDKMTEKVRSSDIYPVRCV
jgi:tRNA (guanine9-N1)-methyltransferase